VPEDQLSLAIGRDGQNARLAAKLTGWRIDIKSLPEAAADALYKLQQDPEYEFLIESESKNIPYIEQLLAKKAEGRPVAPEEYQTMAQFVDRVERGMLRQLDAERRAEDERYQEVRKTIPDPAFELELVDLPLSTKLYDLLVDAGYKTAGDLMLQLAIDSDLILGISGVGPRAMDEIKSILTTLEFPEKAEGEILAETAVEASEEIITDQLVVEDHEAVTDIPVETLEEAGIKAEVEDELELETMVEVDSIPANLEEISPVEPVIEAEEPEEQVESLEELFKLRPETFGEQLEEFESEIEEDEESEVSKKGKKGKKKKRKNVEMEYDPDLDIMVVKRKRKRTGDWDDNWDLS
jgi:transcription termination/antitermination protein NusA